MNPERETVAVLYHRNCPDGFGGAYAAWRAMSGQHVVYTPLQYGEPPPALGADCRLYIIDFSFPRDVMEALHLRHGPENVRLLDHHATARDELEGMPNCRIEMERSGAVLAWQEFHDGPAPPLFAYLQDRDLWRWELAGSREIAALVSAYPYDFDEWKELEQRVETDFARSVSAGAEILRANARQLERLLEIVRMTDVGGYMVPTVNSALLVSEVGEAMLAAYPDRPFAAIYHDDLGFRKWSVRGRGDFDLATLARTLGGGGHRNAAAFKTLLPSEEERRHAD